MSFGKKSTTKSERIYIRFEQCEKATLQEAADAAGLTVSAYVRKRALGHRVMSRTDQIRINALRELHSEARKIGGLVKQLHITRDGIYSRETAEILQAQARLLDGIKDAVLAITERQGGD
jgi:hypothetical protein